MTASLFDSVMYGGLVSDPTVSDLLSDRAAIQAMIQFEAALARAQAGLGVIPEAEGRRLAEALEQIEIAPERLTEGAAQSAVPAPALVAALRAAAPPETSNWLHWGATSQDVIDTSLMLRLRQVAEIADARLERIAARLAALADAHRDTVCLGRTWSQQATPTRFGLLCAQWLGPIPRLRQRLAEMRPRVFALQLGGAVGDLAAMGPQALAVRDALAAELGLAAASPWHAQRDRVQEFSAWCASVAGALAKIGADLVTLSQPEIGEVALGAVGGSSTMPQKQNPVGPSTLVALARLAAAEHAAVAQSAIHGLARDGQAWVLEWASLSSVVAAAAGAGRVGEETLAGLAPDADRMRVNLDAAGDAPFAEAISFALAAHLPRAEAQRLTKEAALAARRDGRALTEVLRERTDAPIDWSALMRADRGPSVADALIDQALAEAIESEARRKREADED